MTINKEILSKIVSTKLEEIDGQYIKQMFYIWSATQSQDEKTSAGWRVESDKMEEAIKANQDILEKLKSFELSLE